LPDPTKEKELTTFITLWKDTKEDDLESTIDRCQMAEEVINMMQNIKGEAQAMYDEQTLRWCQSYTTELREMQLRKFDEVTAKFMEYLEKYIKLSDD
jgi:hypothetical protein